MWSLKRFFINVSGGSEEPSSKRQAAVALRRGPPKGDVDRAQMADLPAKMVTRVQIAPSPFNSMMSIPVRKITPQGAIREVPRPVQAFSRRGVSGNAPGPHPRLSASRR
jgi:hypothetical protein